MNRRAHIQPLGGPPRFNRRDLGAKLRAALRGRAQEAFLFGSYASGTATSLSDVDLLVIADSARPFVDRFRDFWDIVQNFAPIDLIVYTPSEWRACAKSKGSFWGHARKTWVPLLEHKPARYRRRLS